MMGSWRSTRDIISNLPSNIVENILKYLPLRDAGRTSGLSRRWRYKWVTLPQLVFKNEFFLSLGDSGKIKAAVYRVLLLHQGPLIKFELYYPPFKNCLDIDNWILMLLKKNIQDFTLRPNMRQQASRHELPCHLFSFLQLKHLALINCVFKPLPIFKGFSRLVDLRLVDVILAPEMLGQFISNCPLLERLRLFHCTQFDFLVINAPNLKEFIFVGTLKSISFKNTPLLARISIQLFSSDANVKWTAEEAGSEWVRFFQRLPAAIEDIHLDGAFLENICKHKIFSTSSLNKLRKVKMWNFSGAESEMQFAKILLAHSAILEKMRSSETDPDKRRLRAHQDIMETTSQDFTLHMLKGDLYKLPSSLYSCLQLKHLNLRSCMLKPPPGFQGFTRLLSLRLRDVVIADDVLSVLISSCPLLEDLRIFSSTSLDSLEIVGPKLKYVKCEAYFRSICFTNTPCLGHVSICLNEVCKGDVSSSVVLLDSVPVIEFLELDYCYVKGITAGGLPTRLPATLNNLKNLRLNDICFDERDEVSFLICLFRSSPNLEEVTIYAFLKEPSAIPIVLDFSEVQGCSDVALNQLRKNVTDELRIVKELTRLRHSLCPFWQGIVSEGTFLELLF
ncbi:hypothetical protein Vadar_008492 [Vaccinium darrowii]|uniref:Uncharacterized protein n=1 Tax=Vaccinium darrowii TaxID=229202 RepID=A0ACB7WYZ3_9ERIC|nr:hypothetical protein Vadar_008492 [Vaccinium darrowii]